MIVSSKQYAVCSKITRGKFVYCLLLTAYCLLPAGAWASDLTVKTTIDRDTITVGDPIKYTISINAARGFSPGAIKLPDKNVNIYPFEVLSYRVIGNPEIPPTPPLIKGGTKGNSPPPLTKGGWGGFVLEYTISIYQTGEYEIPPIEIIYVDESEIERGVTTTGKHKVKVKSILPEGAPFDKLKDLKDIKGPLSLKERKGNGEGRRNILFLLFFVFALLLFAIFYIISRKEKRTIEPPKSITPSDIALRELEGIKALSLFEKGEIKRCYALIADTVRRFIAVRFNVDAVRRTSGEIVDELRDIHSLNGQVELFAGFLHNCDIVKFSKYNPTVEEARSIMKRAEEIIVASCKL